MYPAITPIKGRYQPCNIARHKALSAWHAIIQRAGNARGNKPTYVAVELRMTKQEFVAWAVPRYRRWFKQHPGVVAFIDRRDNFGHYEIPNLRLVTRLVSTRNKRHRGRKPVYPIGFHWCRVCQALLLLASFFKRPGQLCRKHDVARRTEQRRAARHAI